MAIDLAGQRFGSLLARAIAGHDQHGSVLWFCDCDCGKTAIVTTSNLRKGGTTSCGCYRAQVSSERNRKYPVGFGWTSRLYRIWLGMHKRCYDPTAKGYPRYGGRGISVCLEWHWYELFGHWAITHGYDDHLEIDRIENKGGYQPDNCRWVTKKDQHRNRRNNRPPLLAFGEWKTPIEWSEDPRCHISYDALALRITRGWTTERAISTPLLRRRS